MNNMLAEFGEIFGGVLPAIQSALPKVLFAIVSFIVVLIAAKLIQYVVVRILRAFRVDELMVHLKKIDFFKKMDFSISRLFGKILFWSILVIYFMGLSEKLGLKAVSDGFSSMLGYLPKLLSAGIFFLFGTLFANLIKEVLSRTLTSFNIAASRVISSFIFYFFVVLVAITALNQTGIDTSVIAENVTLAMGAILFAFAFGYGIASKDLMASMIASFYSKNKFSVGQKIRLDDLEGTISKIDGTSITVKTNAGSAIIPLSKFLNHSVEILDSPA